MAISAKQKALRMCVEPLLKSTCRYLFTELGVKQDRLVTAALKLLCTGPLEP